MLYLDGIRAQGLAAGGVEICGPCQQIKDKLILDPVALVELMRRGVVPKGMAVLTWSDQGGQLEFRSSADLADRPLGRNCVVMLIDAPFSHEWPMGVYLPEPMDVGLEDVSGRLLAMAYLATEEDQSRGLPLKNFVAGTSLLALVQMLRRVELGPAEPDPKIKSFVAALSCLNDMVNCPDGLVRPRAPE